MKTIAGILTVCFVLITASIIYIIRSGVSIRTAPIIKPSAISADFHNVPNGVFLRLFPDFQQADYVLWGLPANSTEAQTTLQLLKERHEKEFKNSVTVLSYEELASPSQIQNCSKPCWILLPENQAHELHSNSWAHDHLKQTQKNYFTVTWIKFIRTVEVSEKCKNEKRLDLECLKSVSVREVLRKMKDPEARYFFMRKYLDRDYFLFIEDK